VFGNTISSAEREVKFQKRENWGENYKFCLVSRAVQYRFSVKQLRSQPQLHPPMAMEAYFELISS
jgi:hypothetical protein